MKNTHLSLDPTSTVRMDALNTIKYTLFLDYAPPQVTKNTSLNSSQFIPRLMESCQKCCRGLFTTPDSSSIQYNFFGSYLTNSSKDFFKGLDSAQDFPSPSHNSSQSTVGFHTMLLQHCIMSSYHAILTDLLHDQYISSYQVINQIKQRGIYYLHQKHRLPLATSSTKEMSFFSPNVSKCYRNSKSSDDSSESDLWRLTDTHAKRLSDLFSLMVQKVPEHARAYKYSLQFSELCHHICNIPAPDFNVFNPNYKRNDLLMRIENIANMLEPKTSFQNENVQLMHYGHTIDGLYHYYLAERLFNTDLFYHLLNNILQVERNYPSSLCQSEILTTLAYCKKLPNVFSRNYFLKYAFTHLVSKPASSMDFWHNQELELDHKPFITFSNISSDFQFSRWQAQYSLFIDHMTKLVIPVYEWCFLNMLLESVERAQPSNSHNDHLITAMKLLAGYIYNRKNNTGYYAKILRAMPFTKEDCSIIAERKKIAGLKNPLKESILYIKQLFWNTADDTELNLIPLNPSLFINGNNDNCQPNIRRIRKFYISLIHSSHFKESHSNL